MVKKYESGLSTRLMEKDNELERSFGFWTPAVSRLTAVRWERRR